MERKYNQLSLHSNILSINNIKNNMRKFAIIGCLLLSVLGSAKAQTTEKVSIDGAKGKLAAIIQKPKVNKGDKVSMAIICHGFTSSKDRSLIHLIADSLQQKGIASIRFDFNGHGESDGKLEEMTVLNELEDARRVVAYCLTLPWVKDVSIVGHSQGGVVASMIGGELGSGIRCLALCAPAAVLRDDALRGQLMDAHYDAGNLPDYVDIHGGKNRIGKAYFESAQTLPIYETASRYEGPALIVHGSADRVVPYTYGERYKQVLKDAELVLMPGVDHSFTGEQAAERCAGTVASFMARHL